MSKGNRIENDYMAAVDEKVITVVYVWEWSMLLEKGIWNINVWFIKWSVEAWFKEMHFYDCIFPKGFVKTSITKYLTYVLSFSPPSNHGLRPSWKMKNELLCIDAVGIYVLKHVVYSLKLYSIQ